MAKRKAEVLSQAPSMNGSKKLKQDIKQQTKPNLLDDSDSDSSDESDGGAKLDTGFKINEDYAKKFEHNSKRAELHRLEEKYQSTSKPKNGKQYGDKYDEDSESSSDPEDEDDEGILATEDLDAQITATLKAIRSKDPAVYNKDVTFYAPIEEGGSDDVSEKTKKEKPMHLSDYHRQNLLSGYTGAGEDEAPAPRTFAQEQEDLKKSIVSEMHAAAEDDSEDGDEDGGFLVPKPKPKAANDGIHPSRASKVKVDVDVKTADKDPENFLSNFMAARAWVPSDGSRFQPFESDDEEEDERAEKFEEAYNLRFEDPKGSNEMLKSYARDVVVAKSVRRDEVSGRKKQRDLQREKKEAEKRERDEERAQLRRLKIEEAEEKLQKIKKAAGIRGKALKSEEWTKFLGEDWDDERWELEMNKRFGDSYYAELEAGSDSGSDDEAEAEGKKKKKKKDIQKPEWDDDIDIKDLIPDFDDEETSKPTFTLSDSDEEMDDDDDAPKKSKKSKDRQKEKQEKKRAARLERKKIEEFVDSKMDLDLPTRSKQPSVFKYRETSPTSFGLTARDILMAPEAALNEFAGLKKIATFRDAEKKRKDKKHLGKKARLRQWRKDTFGNEDGPEVIIGGNNDDGGVELTNDDGVDIVEGGRKKKKRSRKSKGTPGN
ncbi:Krr1-domain-containing protein [Acephala macrosclerotiorum]|nr:Krr1-domain-containing protein [Acephala macrosclerotiorum]